jgi:hypothetical protein
MGALRHPRLLYNMESCGKVCTLWVRKIPDPGAAIPSGSGKVSHRRKEMPLARRDTCPLLPQPPFLTLTREEQVDILLIASFPWNNCFISYGM